MELFFIFSALRRYFWILLVCAALGAGVGVVVSSSNTDDRFESQAVLLISPPDERAPGVFTGDPDRFIEGQLKVLRSQQLARRVADRLDDSPAPAEIAGEMDFLLEPRSNIVDVTARAADGERAEQIVTLYLEEYLELLQEEVDAALAPEIEEIDRRLEETNTRLAEIEAEIAATLAPFLGQDVVPSIEQLSPGLVTEKNLLVDRLRSLESGRVAELTALQVSTIVGEPATDAVLVPSPSVFVPVAAGTVLGGFVGFVLALMLASISPILLGKHQAEEILGQRVVGSFPVLRGVQHDRIALFDDLEPSSTELVSTLAIRAEAASDGVAAVVVTGTNASVGSTTVAAALARGFAASGARVLLVDADLRDPELTERFGAANEHPGREDAPSGVELRSLEKALGHGVGQSPTGHRPGMAALRNAVGDEFDAIVVDGGALLATPSTALLATGADAVVVVMPELQPTRQLEAVAAQLASVELLLPVQTPVRIRRGVARLTR